MVDQTLTEISLVKGVSLRTTQVTNIDLNVTYGSAEHLIFAIPALIISCIFNILPTLLLLFYPFQLFRVCLSKCKLNGLALYTFVEKFYGCYRNGLDGGKDMRSFAGLYFILRVTMFFTNAIGALLSSDPYFIRGILFTATLVLISLCRPYKEMYMNVLDIMLLANLALLCHLVSSYDGFKVQAKFVLTVCVMVLLPFAGFLLLLTVKLFRKL